jgi:hypothetical protein
MLTSPTLTADEFKVIHNALCYAQASNVEETVSTIRGALARAYADENRTFDGKMDHFSSVQEAEGFISVWSDYGVTDMDSPHPYPSDAVVVYDTLESEPVRSPVLGSSWRDVHRAADLAIRESGDLHHIFIEGFSLENGNDLRMWTGS